VDEQSFHGVVHSKNPKSGSLHSILESKRKKHKRQNPPKPRQSPVDATVARNSGRQTGYFVL